MNDPNAPIPTIQADEALPLPPAALLRNEETAGPEPCPPGIDCGSNPIYKGNEK